MLVAVLIAVILFSVYLQITLAICCMQ